MWHPTDDRTAMSPAPVVAAAMPLWDWAAAQAEAAKELDEKIAAARERHARALVVLHESMEYRELEAAREALRDAKKAAVETDPAVAKTAEALKKAKAALKKSAATVIAAEKAAKGDVKALVEAQAETERAIVGALKAGRVPSDSDFVVERT